MIGERATTEQIVSIHKMLLQTLEQQENGSFRYRGNATDDTIAQELKCPVFAVKRVRRENFGKLQAKYPSRSSAEIVGTINAVIQRINNMESWAKRLIEEDHQRFDLRAMEVREFNNALANIEARLDRIERWGSRSGLHAVPCRLNGDKS